MSHDRGRKGYFGRDRERDRDWDRSGHDYRDRGSRSGGGRVMPRKRSRSLTRNDLSKRRSRTPRKNDKDMIDDNILSEISKLPEPSELWDSNQFQEGGYVAAPPPPSFQREPPNQNYGSNYQTSYSNMYDDFPPLASAPQHPADMASWNQMALPPPPAPPYHNPEDQLKKEAAIESEMRQQKAALSKQREDYIKKSAILKKELDTLKDQRNELRGDAKRSPSPDTKRFLKENTKLQLEIQNKLKTINNVVDMLNGIIGEEAAEIHESDESPDRKRKSRSPLNQKFNYVYYDPEMHWCRVCNEFPPTAKDYLNHLHSAAHHKMAAQHMEAPWHSVTGVNEGFPSVASAPTKRTPIRGLQFFVPSTAWYCKLCDQFIGDLHCASAHLKSIVHSKNYTNFVEQNPHWETDWMSDRQKAFEKARAGNKLKAIEEKPSPYTAHTITFSKDGFHTKRPKKSPTPQPEEKKKKKDKKKKGKRKRDSSSSSSSPSDSSESESSKKKKVKSKKLKDIDVTDDKALEQWMSTIHVDKLSDGDRKLLDSLKTRIKKEREEKQNSTARDIERVTEMQRKLRESERRSSRSREEKRKSRDRRDGSRERRDGSRDRRDSSRDRREETRARDRWDRRDKRDEPQDKKPEIKKMPFIGKMPVFKHLGKSKAEEQKKEEQKKKEEADNTVKKRQEMDAEIQRKVAEFKQKIAAAALERANAGALPPPALALPAALGTAHPPPLVTPHPPAPAPAPAPPTQPALPKDFQEALDIIFPSDQKTCNEKIQHDLFNAMQQPSILGMPPGMGMPQFPPLGLMQPPGMFGFDLNAGLFPQPQLYDSHVPMMPNQSNKPRPNKINRKKVMIKQEPVTVKTEPSNQMDKKNGEAAAKKKEEMDDLAMLGIDASDVGAGI